MADYFILIWLDEREQNRRQSFGDKAERKEP